MNKHLLAAMLVVPAALSADQVLANPYLNGTQINGLSFSGPGFQGTQISGLVAAGPIVQLIQSQNAATVPNWSALPVSEMTVRLAPEI